jgi:ABC-type nickel/cobalt efflux system permease component RcnA/Tol biopolymer transport system component
MNMKRKFLLLQVFLLCLLSFTGASTVYAHPADVYTHAIHITITQTNLNVQWEIKPGPMLVAFIWNQADVNQDDSISADEANQWADSRASALTISIGTARLPLKLEAVDFPSSKDSFQAGEQFITFHLAGQLPKNTNDTYSLLIHNGMEEPKSLNWYYLATEDGVQFQTPQQKNANITFKVYPPTAQVPADEKPLSAWDSSQPSLGSWTGGSQNTQTQTDAVSQAAQNVVPELQQQTPQEILLDLVKTKNFSFSFYFFALGISLALGALHALTPGHGKTVVAAYLVGSRGTTWHAIALGTIVTLTHTGSVFLLGIITLAASKYILPTAIIPLLEIVSGLLIVGLGAYLLWQRVLDWRKSLKTVEEPPARKISLSPAGTPSKPVSGKKNIVIARRAISPTKQSPLRYTGLLREEHPRNDGTNHPHTHSHGGKEHSHAVPETLTWRSLVALGVSGGLVPCPDAIAILLVAIAIQRIMLGLALIVSFSLGLAIVLITIGLLMVNSRKLFDRFDRYGRFAKAMPVVSALAVTVLGLALTYGAVAKAQGNVLFAGSGSSSSVEANVLYIAEDAGQVKQLMESDVKGGNPKALTSGTNSVTEYALSADGSRLVYIAQTDNLQTQVWMMDLESGENKMMLDCGEASCGQPVWSPDGSRVVFEYMSMEASNATGLPTLWWLDITTGKSQPLFQENLPGGNPRFSPDGKWLSYAAPEGVKLYNLETGESRVIQSTLGTAANWSPDGTKVLYRDVMISNNQFVTQLFVYDLESGKTTNINPDLGFENIIAVWSPDGAWIAVVRRDLGATRGDQVWVMRADGSDARAVTDAPDVLHGSLNWSADGSVILYDLYPLNTVPLISRLEMVEVESGKVTDIGIQGFNPSWVK